MIVLYQLNAPYVTMSKFMEQIHYWDREKLSGKDYLRGNIPFEQKVAITESQNIAQLVNGIA